MLKPLIGLLLVISGVILAVPQIYDVLAYIEFERWPIVQGILGIACICLGLFYLVWQPGSGGGKKKTLVEV